MVPLYSIELYQLNLLLNRREKKKKKEGEGEGEGRVCNFIKIKIRFCLSHLSSLLYKTKCLP